MRAAHPDRFIGMGTVAPQHPTLAVEQLEEAASKFGMRGFMIGGSYLPFYIARSDICATRSPALCRNVKPIKKAPSEYLKQLYFDSMVFTSEGLRHLVAEAGVGQVLMGTDFPAGWTNDAVDHVLATSTLSDADKRAILGENAARLLRIPA